MKLNLKTSLLAAVAIIASNSASAQDEEKSNWSGNIDANALFSSGNTSQTSFGVGGKVMYESGLFTHTATAFADFNKSSGVTDRERYGVGYNLQYDFSEKVFLTLDGAYENNKFGAFRERITAAGGIGYRFKDTETLKWTLEAAPSMIYTKEVAGEDYVSDFSAFTRSNVAWQITDTTKFTNVSSAYFGGRSIIEVKTAVEFKIMDSINSKFSYDVLYNGDATEGRKSTDTIARVGLSYGF